MSSGQKALNVLGIIVAWILSIILVVLLFVSPLLLSTLSVVTPENLKKTVTSIEIPDLSYEVIKVQDSLYIFDWILDFPVYNFCWG